MTFADNIKRICAERGTNLTTVVKKVKGSSSFVTAINKGSLPKESELIEFAQELNCSVMDFFADEENFALRDELRDEDERDILRVYRSLSRRDKHKFMSMVYNFENKDNTANLYRAARSDTHSEPTIVFESKDKIKDLKRLPKVQSEDDL